MYTELILDFENPIKQEYEEDILLYSEMQARLVKRDRFEIYCPMSKTSYSFTSLDKNVDAACWVSELNKMIKSL